MARPATSSVGRERTRSARAPTDAGDATAQPRSVTRTVARRVLWPGRETASRNVARAPPERTTCRPAALDRASPAPPRVPVPRSASAGWRSCRRPTRATSACSAPAGQRQDAAPRRGTQRLARRVHPRGADAPDEPHRARAERGPCLLHRRASSGRQLAIKRARAAGGIGPKIAIPLPSRIGKSTSCDHPAPSVTVTLTTSPEVS